jgi:hypothetical protein
MYVCEYMNMHIHLMCALASISVEKMCAWISFGLHFHVG